MIPLGCKLLIFCIKWQNDRQTYRKTGNITSNHLQYFDWDRIYTNYRVKWFLVKVSGQTNRCTQLLTSTGWKNQYLYLRHKELRSGTQLGSETKVEVICTGENYLIYCKYTYELTSDLYVKIFLLSWVLKHCFSGLKLEWDLILCFMKVILYVKLWKYISRGNCDYFTLLNGNPPNILRVTSILH